MIRGIVVCGWLGVGALVAAGIQGYVVEPATGVETHFTLALAAVAILVFTDLCLGIYLVGTARLLREEPAPAGRERWDQDDRLRRGAVLAALALAALAVGSVFAVGPGVYTGDPPGTHHLLFFVALSLQIAALMGASRELRRGAAALRARESARTLAAPGG